MPCLKNAEGISVRGWIDSHLFVVTEIFSALLPANTYFMFLVLL